MRRVVVLGSGYTGEFLMDELRLRGFETAHSSRTPALRRVPSSQPPLFRFDLEDRETWQAPPFSWGCVWLFPAVPSGTVAEFVPHVSHRFERVVVIGTTSSYLPVKGNEPVTESAPLDHASSRVAGEELLRKKGAIVLRSAGIYGPAGLNAGRRNPLDWLRRGLISDAGRMLNLIQVKDLVTAIVAALESPLKEEQFIVTDGNPVRWGDIARWGKEKGYLDTEYFAETGRSQRESKHLSNEKLLAQLKPNFLHTDLWRELELLEGN